MHETQRHHLEELRKIYTERLRKLEKQAATFGAQAPPHILLELDDLKNMIADLDNQLFHQSPQAYQPSTPQPLNPGSPRPSSVVMQPGIKQNSLAKGILLGVSLILGICLCVAVLLFNYVRTSIANFTVSSQQTAVAASKIIGQVGERVEINNIALTVIKVERKEQLSDFAQADPNNIYVVADILIENIGRDKVSYGWSYFTVKAADGLEYDAESFTGLSNSLRSGDLFKGDKIRGIVAFKTKRNAQGLVMTYEPIAIFSEAAPIRIKLDE